MLTYYMYTFVCMFAILRLSEFGDMRCLSTSLFKSCVFLVVLLWTFSREQAIWYCNLCRPRLDLPRGVNSHSGSIISLNCDLVAMSVWTRAWPECPHAFFERISFADGKAHFQQHMTDQILTPVMYDPSVVKMRLRRLAYDVGPVCIACTQRA